MLDLKSLVRSIPDYPKKGIMFRDITTLIEDPAGFRESVDRLAGLHRELGITHVAGIEARGFIFGAGVAIALEYGVDTIEIHADVIGPGDKVLLVDDLIATGGTAVAAVSLLRRTGAEISHSGFVIDLFDLGGADKLRAIGVRVEALIPFDGH
jgi:adenine phosphoribosyltransferase